MIVKTTIIATSSYGAGIGAGQAVDVQRHDLLAVVFDLSGSEDDIHPVVQLCDSIKVGLGPARSASTPKEI